MCVYQDKACLLVHPIVKGMVLYGMCAVLVKDRLLVCRGGCCVVAIAIDMLIAIQVLTAVVCLSCGSCLVGSSLA